VDDQAMVLLHGFVKKSQKTPIADLKTASLGIAEGVIVVGKKHIGGDFDDFLREEGILDEAEAVATKRVIAYQIAQEMERVDITQAELARRMKTSRSAVERLLDPTNPSVTLSTLERAASAVGKRLTVQLSA
jgi:predicted XRE-type DNA-binding protein